MHFVYHNDLTQLGQLAADIEAFGQAQGLNHETVHAFNLCLDEVFTNIVSYGYGDHARHEIQLDLEVTAHETVATIRDDARAYDPLTEAPVPDLHAAIEDRKIGGLGVHFVKTLMSRVHYRREHGHNILEMARVRHHPVKPH